MIAGATGIDLFLLVIDAQEGARPQTLEHLAVLRLLGVDRGVVAVTKADAVDEETLALALDEARELVPGRRGRPRLGEDRRRARRAARRARPRAGRRSAARHAATRLYVDRVVHAAGRRHGRDRDALVRHDRRRATCCASSRAGRVVRVRSVQVHDDAVDRAEAGPARRRQPADVERRDLARGDVLVEPGPLPGLLPARRRARDARRDAGGGDGARRDEGGAARVVRDGAYAQLRLTEPVVAARGDRVVLRTETTVGGGLVLDPAPPRRLEPERLGVLDARLHRRRSCALLVHEPVTGRDLQARGLLAPGELAQGLASVRAAGEHYFSAAWLDDTARASARSGSRHARRRTRSIPGCRSPSCCPQRAVGAVRPEPARDRAPRREGLPAGRIGDARRARPGCLRARGAARPGGDREGRRQAARRVPRGARPAAARRRRLRGFDRRCTTAAASCSRRSTRSRSPVPRRARGRQAHRAAPARALRHGRADVASRRRRTLRRSRT